MGDGERTYRGVPGAFRYSFRMSSSLTYKSYALVSGLLTVIIAILFTFGLIGIVAGTLGASELVTLVRSFFILVGLIVVIPILAPVLLVARRHRKSGPSDSEYDTMMAVAGYGFIVSLYLGLLISVPREQQESVEGVLAPFVEVFYSFPQFAGLIPPIVAILVLYAIHVSYR